jgi:hypothetical protein
VSIRLAEKRELLGDSRQEAESRLSALSSSRGVTLGVRESFLR